MGIIAKTLPVAGSKGSRDCEVLFDTGASQSFIQEDVATEIAEVLKAPKPMTFRLGNGAQMTVDRTTDLFLEMSGRSLFGLFAVAPDLPYEVIAGADFFQRWKIKLDPATEDFILDEKALRLQLL